MDLLLLHPYLLCFYVSYNFICPKHVYFQKYPENLNAQDEKLDLDLLEKMMSV